jgi:hypothetical protein
MIFNIPEKEIGIDLFFSISEAADIRSRDPLLRPARTNQLGCSLFVSKSGPTCFYSINNTVKNKKDKRVLK